MTISVLLLAAIVALAEATIPIYYDCQRTILLSEDQPAARLRVTFTSSRGVPSSDCMVRVQKNDTKSPDKIGVLLQNSAQFRSSSSHCYRGYSSMLTVEFGDQHFSSGNGNQRRYCATRTGNITDTYIASQCLNFSWTKYGGTYKENFDIFVFLYSFEGVCHLGRVSCAGWGRRRCIPGSIICQHPYKYCGDGSYLCPSLVSTDNNDWISNTNSSTETDPSMIITVVTIVVVAVLLLCMCSVCCKSRIKRFLNSETSNSGTPSIASSEQMTPSAPTLVALRELDYSIAQRESSSVSGGVISVNAGFTEDPPVYESLDTTDVNVNVNDDAEKDDLPPSYESVVANAQEYKVDDSTS